MPPPPSCRIPGPDQQSARTRRAGRRWERRPGGCGGDATPKSPWTLLSTHISGPRRRNSARSELFWGSLVPDSSFDLATLRCGPPPYLWGFPPHLCWHPASRLALLSPDQLPPPPPLLIAPSLKHHTSPPVDIGPLRFAMASNPPGADKTGLGGYEFTFLAIPDAKSLKDHYPNVVCTPVSTSYLLSAKANPTFVF